MEKRNNLQTAKEGRLMRLQPLARHNPLIADKQKLQSNHPEKAHHCSSQHRQTRTGLRGMSCIDQSFPSKQIIEEGTEHNTFYAVFIDLEQAFDSTHRESLR